MDLRRLISYVYCQRVRPVAETAVDKITGVDFRNFIEPGNLNPGPSLLPAEEAAARGAVRQQKKRSQVPTRALTT